MTTRDAETDPFIDLTDLAEKDASVGRRMRTRGEIRDAISAHADGKIVTEDELTNIVENYRIQFKGALVGQMPDWLQPYQADPDYNETAEMIRRENAAKAKQKKKPKRPV